MCLILEANFGDKSLNQNQEKNHHSLTRCKLTTSKLVNPSINLMEHLQILLLILSQFKRINHLLSPCGC